MRLLGIDYGLKRIGLAISDGTLASPIGQVGDIDHVLRMIQDHGVEKIILGLPDPNNTRIKGFGDRLHELTGLPVEYWDEAYSTKIARQEMIASGSSEKSRREEIDQNAAAVILQNYVDQGPQGLPL
jgi:putative Holliday junction resolvase